MSGAAPSQPDQISIRRAVAADVAACAPICFEAFRQIAERHNFPLEIPVPEIPAAMLSMMFSHPGFFCVVAEQNGTILGSNCLDERSVIAGVGPITVSPSEQNRSIGRRLMRAVMDRASERGCPGVRLVQAGYNTRSLSLYAKLGFAVREPLACMLGPAIRQSISGFHVRRADIADVEACSALARRVHGHNREGELRDAIAQGSAVLVESRGRITGYASSVAFFGHAVAETNDDLEAILAAAPEIPRPDILVPTRNASLVRWCLEHGLRVITPMNLMAFGLYNEPAGAFLPSITF